MKADLSRYTVLLGLTSLLFLQIKAQRAYKSHSVLASGNWFKIAVSAPGIYKLDASFLTSLGISGAIPSSQLRVFGKKETILPESNATFYEDDLQELALDIFDGGDGILTGSDYALFYAIGPDAWETDTVNRRFSHKKNLYSNQVYYYISVGGPGKRIQLQNQFLNPLISVHSFDERFFHELDSVNFLSSGKEWFGEEFSNLPGHVLSRQFTLPISDASTGSSFTLITNLVGRSVNAASAFNISMNNNVVQQVAIPATGPGIYDLFAQQVQSEATGILSASNIIIGLNYAPGSFNAQGWLNWFELFFRRQLILQANQQLHFRDWNSVGNNAIEYVITAPDPSTHVWDITSPLAPVKMNTQHSANEIKFTADGTKLHEYISFSSSFLTPQAIGLVAKQDLHNTTETDYFIITHLSLLPQAQRLADFHQQKNKLRTVVVTTEQIFNEFSAGIPDPTALRDFIKMYFDKYGATWEATNKYVCLFGKASFDYKNRIGNNTNFVPAYESVASLDPLATYTSDDFFGFLNDHEDINSGMVVNELDIGIGRIPAKNIDEAKNFVDKIEAYFSTASFGPWRNNLNFIADDEDFNLHLQDAEVLTATAATTAPIFNPYKIYLDAYRQEGSSAGGRYPQANAVINNNIYNGVLIWNYNGHGGPQRLAEEVVLDQQIVNTWNNINRLPLMVTATCDFAPYDNPTLFSLGEHLLMRPKTGAIGLMTTTRVVFAFSNRIMNNNYLAIALQRDSLNKYKSLGTAMKEAKNFTYRTSGDIINNRKFALLGDPAMTLGFPQLNVNPLTINGQPFQIKDTISATEFVNIGGEVLNELNQPVNDFNGTVFLSLFDKPQTLTTLGNDPASLPVQFASQSSTLYKGKVSATNGKFTFKFRLPKDINFQFGAGKLSFYAQDNERDGAGFSSGIIIGGIASGSITDNEGPEIKAYLNDDRFVNGSITNETPVLLLKLSDSSGINTGNAGIDHDIVATLDGDNRQFYVLNDFYETDLDSYQQGTLRFQLPTLQPGPHTLKIKAWDVLNNSNETTLQFIVANDHEMVLDHVLNYPNPFTTKTSFWFEHNKPGLDLKTKIEIFTVSGKLIKTLSQTINTAGNRSNEVEWDGKDEYGNRIGRGVYLYRLTVQSADGKRAQKMQRLVIIQ